MCKKVVVRDLNTGRVVEVRYEGGPVPILINADLPQIFAATGQGSDLGLGCSTDAVHAPLEVSEDNE